VQCQVGGSGHWHNPPPGRCGQLYAGQQQAGDRLEGLLVIRSKRFGIGPRWCRPECAMQKSSPQTAQALQGLPPFFNALHCLNFFAFSL